MLPRHHDERLLLLAVFGALFAFFYVALAQQDFNIQYCPNEPGTFIRLENNNVSVVRSSLVKGEFDSAAIESKAITKDNFGNVYLVGTYSRVGKVIIDATFTMPEGSFPYCFVGKYPPSGNIEWAKSIWPEGTATWDCKDIAVSSGISQSESKLVITGLVQGVFDIYLKNYVTQTTTTKHVVSPVKNLFLMTLNATNGEIIDFFITKATSQVSILVNELEHPVSVRKYIYVSGDYSGAGFDIGKFSMPQSDGQNLFIARFDLDTYEVTWVLNPVINSASVSYNSVRSTNIIETTGQVYFVGVAQGTLTIGNITLESDAKFPRAIIGKASVSGEIIWLKQCSPKSTGNSIVVRDNRVVVSGVFHEAISCEGVGLRGINATSDHIFLAQLDNDGDVKWIIDYRPISRSQVQDLSMSKISDDIYITFMNDFDTVIARLTSTATGVWEKVIKNVHVNDITIGNVDDINICGYFTTAELHPSLSYSTVGRGTVAFLAKFIQNCSCDNPDCRVPTCNGQIPTQEQFCSRKGKCVGVNQCRCLEGWYGDSCQFPLCSKIPSFDRNVCSGRGRCIEPDRCLCDSKYEGANCEYSLCFGKNGTAGCSNHGTCEGNNLCRCYDDFTGAKCQFSSANIKPFIPCTARPREYMQQNLTSAVVAWTTSYPVFPTIADEKFSVVLTSHWSKQQNQLIVTGGIRNRQQQGLVVRACIFDHIMAKVSTEELMEDENPYQPTYFQRARFDEQGFIVIVGRATDTFQRKNVVVDRINPKNNTSVWKSRIIFSAAESNTQGNVIVKGGAIYLSGVFSGSLSVGSCSGKALQFAYFVVKLDLYTGDCLWLDHGDRTSCSSAVSQARDELLIGGNFYYELGVQGSFERIYSKGKKPPVGYIAKYLFSETAQSGLTIQWMKALESDLADESLRINSMKVDQLGNIIIAGIYIQGSGTLVTDYGLFIAMTDSQGFMKWIVRIYNPAVPPNMEDKAIQYEYDPHLISIDLHQTGHVIATGYLIGNTTAILNGKKPLVSFNSTRSHERLFGIKLAEDGSLIQSLDSDSDYPSKALDVTFIDEGSQMVVIGLYKGWITLSSPLKNFTQTITAPDGDLNLLLISMTQYACAICENATLANGTCTPCTAAEYFDLDKQKCEEIKNPTGVQLHPFLIVGISVGAPLGILLLVSCVVIIVLIIKTKAQKQKYVEILDMLPGVRGSTSDASGIAWRFDSSKFELKLEQLQDLQEIAQGGSGTVIYRAIWNQDVVAVKGFRTSFFTNEEHFGEFEHELDLLFTLRHPNIINFYGAFFHPPLVGLVLEYAEKGSLLSIIEKEYDKLSWNIKIGILLDIAQGMQFLHNKNVIHRDLKCANILLDRTYRAKVSDFGVSRSLDKRKVQMTSKVGTSYYMAPEVTLGKEYSEKCDVFSFGIMLFEMLTGNTHPYGQTTMNINLEVKVALDPEFRPEIPTDLEEKLPLQCSTLIILMKRAWSANPEERPSFAEIKQELERIHNSFETTSPTYYTTMN